MEIWRVHRIELWMFYLLSKSYCGNKGVSIMAQVKWQIQSWQTPPSKQADWRKLPQGLSEFLLMHISAKSISFSWPRDASFIKPILQMVNTIDFIHCKHASLKALVIPRISVHFPAHLFSSNNVPRDITQRRSRTWEMRTLTLQLLPAQRRHYPAPPYPQATDVAGGARRRQDITIRAGVWPGLALGQPTYASAPKTFIFWRLNLK